MNNVISEGLIIDQQDITQKMCKQTEKIFESYSDSIFYNTELNIDNFPFNDSVIVSVRTTGCYIYH